MVTFKNLKGLNKSEMTVYIYLMSEGLKQAKNISKELETDISYIHKILNRLDSKGLIIKNKINDYIYEYKIKE